jgi:hypothetical protein
VFHLERIGLGGREMTDQTPQQTATRSVERHDVPELLATRLGLPGFAVGDDGRIVRGAGD